MTTGQESALVIAVPESEPLVGAWRARHDYSAQLGVMAHVTLFYPFVHPRELGPQTDERLEALFARQRSFDFALTEPRRFGEQVLWLAPEPSAPFSALTDALCAAFPPLQPYGGVHEVVIPHLTVADQTDVTTMARIEAALVPGLPVACRATEAVLLRGDRAAWSVVRTFALG